ncbi:exostosin domain-containing protein [Citrus sinensis]|uniref:Exostosin domain-containing protein n=1 Tax=Citrus sinensis TaxID=2711 RepID=A0ACB8LGT7_CITSI|nr:exostosin domain-containing protein [Citrus sinensis]
MFEKAILSLIFLLLLVITYSVFIGTVDIRSHFFPLLQSTAQSCSAPLRVYMYDLPRRFHVGMLDHSSPDGLPVTSENLPRWPRSSGIKRQHSVEYWLMASLLYDGESEEREAVRVSDPDTAQAFFVPFFSSLSFNTHGHNMTDPDTEFDRQLQIEILEFLRNSKYWQKSGGRDHVIPMTHPNAFRFLRQQLNATILIVADFGRYPRSMSNLSKDVVAPYVHVVESFTDDNPPDPFVARKTLLFFQGNTIRKDEGKVRAKLAKILTGYDDVHYERSAPTTKSIKECKLHGHSQNILHHTVLASLFFSYMKRTGDTPSSCRLFDAIVSHCVPVIVSDRIELPFEDEIDYSEFSVFFSIKEAGQPGYMIDQLRQIPKERWIEMWQHLKSISHYYEFQYPPKKEDAVNMVWRQVKNKIPGVQLAVHRHRRLKIPDWWSI